MGPQSYLLLLKKEEENKRGIDEEEDGTDIKTSPKWIISSLVLPLGNKTH